MVPRSIPLLRSDSSSYQYPLTLNELPQEITDRTGGRSKVIGERPLGHTLTVDCTYSIR